MFDTKEKKERSLGVKLFLKAERCLSPKCATVRRPTKPGIHGRRRHAPLSEFGEQLKEKQKFQWSYGLKEAQIKRLFKDALKNPAVTGDIFLSLLERRLDNAVYRLGFGKSRSIGRQLVSHGHILVNGRRVTIPSYRVKIGDIISIRAQSRNIGLFKEISLDLKKYEPPGWLNLDQEKLEGTVAAEPRNFDTSFDVNLVVDYYSKVVK